MTARVPLHPSWTVTEVEPSHETGADKPAPTWDYGKQWLADIAAERERAMPTRDELIECNDERCVLPGAHDLGEFGCLVDPGVAPDQPNGDKR